MQAIVESLKGGGALSYLMILVGGAGVTLSLAGVAVGFSKRAATGGPILSAMLFATSLAIALLAFLQRTMIVLAIKRSVPVVADDQKHLLALKDVAELAPLMAIGLVLLAAPLLAGALLWARGARAQPERSPTGAGTAVAILALLTAGAFIYGLGAYADTLELFQTYEPTRMLLAPGFSHPRPVVTLGAGTLTAIVWAAAAVFAIAALLVVIAQRRHASRLTLVTTVITFVAAIGFATLGRSFAIDFVKEFGRGGGLPLVVVPVGLELPTTVSTAPPFAAALVEIDPTATSIDGVVVTPGASMDAALGRPNMKELNDRVVPLMADRRARWSVVAPVIAAAARSGHHLFAWIAEPAPVYRSVMFSDLASEHGDHPLGLTVRINSDGFEITASGGALDPIPLDFAMLHQKMIEIHATFPGDHTVTLVPAADVTVETLVKSCDAVMLKDGHLLFPDVVIRN